MVTISYFSCGKDSQDFRGSSKWYLSRNSKFELMTELILTVADYDCWVLRAIKFAMSCISVRVPRLDLHNASFGAHHLVLVCNHPFVIWDVTPLVCNPLHVLIVLLLHLLWPRKKVPALTISFHAMLQRAVVDVQSKLDSGVMA